MLLAGARGQRRAWRLVVAAVGFALVGAAPAAAAPFVYVTNEASNDLSQFNAPLSSFEALNPLTPATVATGNSPRGVAVAPNGTSAYVTNTRTTTRSRSTPSTRAPGR